MKRPLFLLVALLVFFDHIHALSQTEEYYPTYDIDLKLDPKNHLLSGVLEAEFLNNENQPQEFVYFVLPANFYREKNPYVDSALLDLDYEKGFYPGGTQILSVVAGDGTPLEFALKASYPIFQDYSLAETVLQVRLAQGLAPGTRARLKIEFSTKFPQRQSGDETFRRGVYMWRFGWHPILIPADRWEAGAWRFERYEFPAARYRVRLAVPADFQVAAGSDRQRVLEVQEGWKTLLLESERPQRTMALSLSKNFKVYRLEGRIPVEMHYLSEQHEGTARLVAAYVAEALGFYEARFVEYVHQRLVLVENPGSGLYAFAADGIIFVGNDFFRLKDLPIPSFLDRLLDFVVAHEVAHQWWGIGVGVDYNAENWLSESFAQYISIRYFEEKYGDSEPNLFPLGKGLLEGLLQDAIGFQNLRQHQVELPYMLAVRDGFDEALVRTLSRLRYGNPEHQIDRLYRKGYLVLRALEGLVGRPTLEAILKETYKRFNYKQVSSQEFADLAEKIAQRPLQNFFQQWLYSDSFVDYSIDSTHSEKTADGYITRISVRRRGEIVHPVTVAAITQDGERLEQSWTAERPEDQLLFLSKSPIRIVTVDPQNIVPDPNRLNNHYPRQLQFSFGQTKLPLDAIFINISPLSLSLTLLDSLQINLVLMPRPTPEGELSGIDWNLLGTWLIKPGRAGSFWDDLRWQMLLRWRVEGMQLPMLSGGRLRGEAHWDFTIYEHPKTGSVARSWVPANRLRLTLGVEGQEDPVGYVGLDYWRDDRPKRYQLTHLRLRTNLLDEEALFMTLTVESWRRFRLAPHFYLDAGGQLGVSVGPVHQLFRFTLEELQSFKDVGQLEPGNFKAYSWGRVLCPLTRDLDYSIMNLMRLTEVWAGVVLRVANTWNDARRITFAGFKAEAALELTLKVQTLLDLPFELTYGFAYPLQGFAGAVRPTVYATASAEIGF